MQLREYQTEAVQAIFDFYSKPRKLIDGKPERKNPLICLPTGTGKSLVIGAFAERAFKTIPNTRMFMSTHVKTLIEQNEEKLLEIWPNAPVGIYSAGLKKRNSSLPIIFGGIQSCVGKYPIFGHRDFLFIDEAHLVGDEGSYLKFIAELQQTNPFLKIVGLSATAYRLGLGSLTNGKIFTDIIYDLCNMRGFDRLISAGFLCPLIGKRGNIEIDVSGVGLDRKGDFAAGELSAAIKKQAKTREQLIEFVSYGQNRRCWLLFAAGIEEAEELNNLLNQEFGISSVVLHSKMGDAHNDAALKAWKAGTVRAAVNMNMLTTGVDNPMCDYMGDWQPTTSTGKHVQKNGRLTRPFPGKQNGMIMDYAGNLRRLGPINDPVIPKLKGQGGPGDAPIKICSQLAPRNGCGFFNHSRATECFMCGIEFTFADHTTMKAYEGDVMRSDIPIQEYFKVDRAIYTAHVSKAMKDANPNTPHSQLPFTIKVSYFCNLRTFYEWVTVEGKGGNIKGRDWFRQRFPGEPPETNSEVIALASQLRCPSRIRVWLNAQPNPKVMAAEF